mgnify:CR=1 FL=1
MKVYTMSGSISTRRLSPEELRAIRTKPGRTREGKAFDWLVKKNGESGVWRLERGPADVLGPARAGAR